MATLPIVVPFQTPAQKYEIVKQAIINRKPIGAIYDGKVRLLCPHVLGIDKDGGLQALFYQYGGASNSRPIQPDGSPNNWRCLSLDKLFSIQPLDDDGWHTAPNHSRPQTCVKLIHFEVNF
jgi:hypothetical protein